MVNLGVGLFELLLFGTLCTSWTCMSNSFAWLRKFSVIISSYMFSIHCSPTYPSATPMTWILVHLMLSQRSLNLSSFFYFYFFLFCLGVSAILSFNSLIWFSVSSSLLLCILLFSYWVHFWLVLLCGFYVLFYVYYLFNFSLRLSILPQSTLSILITIVLKSVSGRLLASISFRIFSRVFSCFIWGMFLCFSHFVASLFFFFLCFFL